MFLFASFTKEDRYKVRAFKLKMMERYIGHHVIADEPSTDEINKNESVTDSAVNTNSALTSSVNKNVDNGEFRTLIPELIVNKILIRFLNLKKNKG
ncbi:hypothetical protein EAG08_03980 [Chryseobacterium sp. 3008163]|nr:hypothetical protein EAG08_03980 [Chryseobacterium sp. 3008163]